MVVSELLAKSGVVGYIIIFLFVISFVVSVERLIFLFVKRSSYLSDVDLDSPQETAGDVIYKMESSVWIISLISHIAPLLGMLGTILGLINMFKNVEALGSGVNINIISSGIWEAMLTTAMGISVALFSTVFYRFIERQIEKRTLNIEIYISAEKG